MSVRLYTKIDHSYNRNIATTATTASVLKCMIIHSYNRNIATSYVYIYVDIRYMQIYIHIYIYIYIHILATSTVDKFVTTISYFSRILQ